MKHKNYYEDYSEIMYNERDLIESFLKKQYDIRYGSQRDTWHFEPAVEVLFNNGTPVEITDIKLDDCNIVVFLVKVRDHNCYWCDCTYFAFGELSKVLDALPEVDDIIRKRSITDLKIICRDYNITELLKEHPFNWTDGNVSCAITDLSLDKDGGLHCQHLDNESEKEQCLFTSAKALNALCDHIKVAILHCSDQYKRLKELLSLQENLRFDVPKYEDMSFCIESTDVTFDVTGASIDDEGRLFLYGNDIDADYDGGIVLNEKEIEPRYLDGILEVMEIATKEYTITLDKQSVDDVLNALSFRNEHVNEEVRDRLRTLLNNIKEQINDQG